MMLVSMVFIFPASDKSADDPRPGTATDDVIPATTAIKINNADKPIICVGNNKISPATITYEDDRPNTPNTGEKAANKNAKSAVHGGKDVKEALNRQMAAVAKSGSAVCMRSNKVAPSDGLLGSTEKECEQKADGCTVTCEVEIHRSKTRTPTTRRVGTSDSRMSGDVAGDSPDNNVFSSSESSLDVDVNEKNDETKV